MFETYYRDVCLHL
jgi:hypothetical protein